jgi:hypothetical protein
VADLRSTRRSASVPLLTLAGLAAGLLTVAADGLISRIPSGMWARPILDEFYVGITFGVAIAAYFALHERRRSAWPAGGFIAISAGAYATAMATSISTLPLLPHRDFANDPKIPVPAFFSGGFVGAVLVLAAAVFLFRPNTVRRSTLPKLALGGVVGGLLGMVGWASAPLVGRPFWHAAHALQLSRPWETSLESVHPDQLGMISLFIIWQTGVACSLGLMLAGDRAARWRCRISSLRSRIW